MERWRRISVRNRISADLIFVVRFFARRAKKRTTDKWKAALVSGLCEVHPMFPIVLIAIGVAVLAFGKRLAVLGAAVGALLGVVLLHLIPGSSSLLIQLAIPIGL